MTKLTKLLANREPKTEAVKPMSYILDALKRADSERERGVVPGLHAQPVPLDSSNQAASRALGPLVLLVALGLLLLLCLILWRWLSPSPAPVSAAMPAAPQIIAAAPLAAPIPVRPAHEQPPSLAGAISVTPEVAKNPASNPATAPRMVLAPAQLTPAPSSVERAQDRAEPETRSTPSRALPPPAQPANAQATPAATPAPGGRVVPLAELPADLRLAMPKMVISGATYANNPAYRMLIINGQVFHEGEKLATDLLLEQIGPKSAVLNYKGQRYSVGY